MIDMKNYIRILTMITALMFGAANGAWALTNDDIVIDYDPWTMSQDYDTLVCRKVEVLSVNKDSAVVDVTIFLSENWPEKKIRLEMTNEKKQAAGKADWYIADFQYNGSMAKEISDYLKEYKK